MSTQRANSALAIPQQVLRHEAILYTSAQVPFSAVIETYQAALFDFGPCRRR
jgi:hypothetical protein